MHGKIRKTIAVSFYNKIIQLDNLPFTLKILICGYNLLEQLDNLPPQLLELFCSLKLCEKYTKI
jgi:hypothetical protein